MPTSISLHLPTGFTKTLSLNYFSFKTWCGEDGWACEEPAMAQGETKSSADSAKSSSVFIHTTALTQWHSHNGTHTPLRGSALGQIRWLSCQLLKNLSTSWPIHLHSLWVLNSPTVLQDKHSVPHVGQLSPKPLRGRRWWFWQWEQSHACGLKFTLQTTQVLQGLNEMLCLEREYLKYLSCYHFQTKAGCLKWHTDIAHLGFPSLSLAEHTALLGTIVPHH